MLRISPIKHGLKAENMRRRAQARWKSALSEAASVECARMLGSAAAGQSAAVRRLAALMQQEEQQAEQEKQAVLQRERERVAAAQKAAQESGIDPKTKRQYEYG